MGMARGREKGGTSNRPSNRLGPGGKSSGPDQPNVLLFRLF
jgi:hypothetical protein